VGIVVGSSGKAALVPISQDKRCERGTRLVPEHTCSIERFAETGNIIQEFMNTVGLRGFARSLIFNQVRPRRSIGVWVLLAFAACGLLHVAIGADPLISMLAVTTMVFGLAPIVRFGAWNIGAVLIFLVAFRYVGFPLFAKLALVQALDTHLDQPLAAFAAVAAGVFAYFLAFMMVNNIKVGLPLLRPVTTPHLLRRLSFLAFVVGFTANLELALRVNVQTGAWNISNAFLPCLHLALIAAAASALLKSDGHRMLDGWTLTILVVEVAFAFALNVRTPVLESILALVVTDIAFHGRFTRKQISITIAGFLLFISITPVILYIRHAPEKLGWSERITATGAALANWKEAESALFAYQSKVALSSGFFMRYYDTPTIIFERLSHVNDTDALIAGADRTGKLGFEVIDRAVQYALPRLFVPDKPIDYGEGGWIYSEYEGINRHGNFQTAPLIGVSYASFGWIGVFLLPLFFGSAILLLIKKTVGMNLIGNIWVVYTLITVNNLFVEGGTWSNMAMILRQLPQDTIIMLLFALLIGTNRITFRKA
jgi:hypothetical protein